MSAANRLEYLRGELRAERISYEELAELQSLAGQIDPGDVELLEAAGVPESPEEVAPVRTEPVAIFTAVNITQTYLIPDAHVLNLIECADIGIAYWAERATVDAQGRTYTVYPGLEARTGDPDLVPRSLKFDWIAKRLVQLGADSPLLKGVSPHSAAAGYARRYLAARIDPDIATDADSEFDSELADVVIQLAFFDGEVVFG